VRSHTVRPQTVRPEERETEAAVSTVSRSRGPRSHGLLNWHKAMLHSVPASLGVDDAQRRLIQKNLGGEWSAADMDYAGFCRVMAHYETCGFVDERKGRGWWTAQSQGDRREALRGKVYKLAALAGWIVPGRPPGRDVDFGRIDAFIAAHFAGRDERPSPRDGRCLRDLAPDQIMEIIEALKSIAVQAGAVVSDYYGPARPRRAAGRESVA
jgi:hypothetical protein